MYINAYMEFMVQMSPKCYGWTYVLDRSRATYLEQRPVGTAGEGEGGVNWGSDTETRALAQVKRTDSWQEAAV